MSTPENEEIVVGKDGSEGWLNAEEREAFEEANPDLAAYSSLKFKTSSEKDDEASDEIEAVGAMADTVKGATEEISRLRRETEGNDLARGVEKLLDQAEEVAETVDDYDQAEQFRLQWQLAALEHAAAIEDDELRANTFAKLEERVDAELYEAFAQNWQAAYAEQTEADIQKGLGQIARQAQQDLKTYEAVVTLENDLLNQLSPLEQACAHKLLEAAREEIAQMPAGAAQEAIRTRMEMARDAAAKIEAAHVQEAIVKAHGRTKAGIDGRRLREMSADALGLLPDLTPTVEETHAASARAEKGVRIDRTKAKRIHKGSGPTGMERLQAQQVALAKRMGIEVVDGATGRPL